MEEKTSVNFQDLPVLNDSCQTESDNKDFLGTLCLFYSSSPFSDFAPCPFTLDRKRYHSVEHFIQLQMLESFGLFAYISRLADVVDAFEFHRNLRQLLRHLCKSSDIFTDAMFDEWRRRNMEKMLKKANYAKYQQNPSVCQQLLATGERILLFTSKNDRLLGVGMPESEFFQFLIEENFEFDDLLNALCDEKFRHRKFGRNLLGLILMEIRGEFNAQPSVVHEWKQKMKKIDKSGVDRQVPSYSKDRIDKSCVNDSQIQQCTADASVCASVEHLLNEEERIHSTLIDLERNFEQRNFSSDKIDNQNGRTVVMLPEEKRILYRKVDFVPKVIGEIPVDLRDSCRDSVVVLDDRKERENCQESTITDKQTALERLKALRFEKPVINPFVFTPVLPSVTMATEPSTSKSDAQVRDARIQPRFLTGANSVSVGEGPKVDIFEIRQPKPKKRIMKPTTYSSGDMHGLEPGEIPHPGYKPPRAKFRFQSDYPDIPSLIDMAVENQNKEYDELKQEGLNLQPKIVWKPSANPLKDLLLSAQETLNKLEACGENGTVSADHPAGEPVFPPFPATTSSGDSQNEFSNRKKAAKKRTGKQYNVQFTNDTAMLRHHSNRWVKGGRLSTTGKFEEGDDDVIAGDNGEATATFEEETKIVRTLQDAETNLHKPERYETHVIFDDTSQYEEYLKWYVETHYDRTELVWRDQQRQNLHNPNDAEDVLEDKTEQRRWYRFYQSAVKFVDIPIDSDDDDNDVTPRGSGDLDDQVGCNPYESMSNDDYTLLLQQWRWRQTHEQWHLQQQQQQQQQQQKQVSTSTGLVENLQIQWSDGVYYGSQPVVYKISPTAPSPVFEEMSKSADDVCATEV